jgi:hypothetical protein
MRHVLRLFLIFTLITFIAATSAVAAMPCCSKTDKVTTSDMPDCHKQDKGSAKTSGDLVKKQCECSHCIPVSFDLNTNLQPPHAVLGKAVPAAPPLKFASNPAVIDNPPKQ